MHHFLFIDFQEILLIGVLVVLLFGADKVPEIMRTFGKTARSIRDVTDDIKREIMNPVEELKQETKELNPTHQITTEIVKAKHEIEDAMGSIARED